MKITLWALGLVFLIVAATPSPGLAQPQSAGLPEDPEGVLTLSQAVGQALLKNPELAVFNFEIRAREARKLQAGLLPNPKLDVDLEDVLGTGNFQGGDRSQTTITLSQLIELGGKRSARSRVAELSGNLVNWDYETRRIQVLVEVSQAFTEVLHTQRQLEYADELTQLAKQTLDSVSQQVAAGKVSPVEKVKAEVAFSSTRIEHDRAVNKLRSARHGLAATWGSLEPKFLQAQGQLETLLPVRPLNDLKTSLRNHPDIARWATEMAYRQAQIDLEKSKRVPDLTLKGGFRHFEGTQDQAMVFSLQVPLQFFDRNQGAIREARYRKLKAEAQKRATLVRIQTLLEQVHSRLLAAQSEVTVLKRDVLPGAEKVFAATREGFLFGKFDFLEVLDSQRTLFNARLNYLNALANFHKRLAEVEGLAGEPVANLKTGTVNLSKRNRP